MLATPVLIVGAGPVGGVLALELAHRGVPCIVAERATATPSFPKMDYISGRSMELLRRLGLAEGVRRQGVGAEHPSNFLWSCGFAQPPVLVWEQPSVAETLQRYAEVNDGSAPAEPYQRLRGSVLECLIREALRAHPLVDLREGWTLSNLWTDTAGVAATLLEAATGTRHSISAGYLAACDGARSTVRRCLEIPLDEAGDRTRHCTVYFRSGDPALRKHGRAFITILARGLTLVSRDEEDTWTASIPIPTDEPLITDPLGIIQDRLGTPFEVDEVLGVSQWEGALAVATSYRKGTVYLAGDSAHQFYPTGGHGANTGIADAVDLGWKLAALVQGWGGPRLLDSYEAERRPVALFNRELCAGLLGVWRRFGRLVAAGASREHVAGVLAQEVHQVDNAGVHFGYRYTRSPVICHEDGPPPPWDWNRITPSTWPGGRAPAVRLKDGEQIFDRFGTGFTLVDLSCRGIGAPLVTEAARRSIPMTYLAIDDPAVRACWERDLVLVRPDQHVAWRSDTRPDDWAAVLDRVTGQVVADRTP